MAQARKKAPEALPPRSHNQPPSDLDAHLENLRERNSKLFKEIDKLIADAESAPAVIKKESDLDKVSLAARAIKTQLDSFKALHKDQKEPYLIGGRAVDQFFRDLASKLTPALSGLLARINVYQDKKEEEERARREAEEEAARKEEARLAKIAARKKATVEDQLAAENAREAAQAATAATEAGPAELVRTTTQSGVMVTRSVRWEGRLEDASKLDLEALRPHFSIDSLQKALNAFVRAGGRELRGAIIEETKNPLLRGD